MRRGSPSPTARSIASEGSSRRAPGQQFDDMLAPGYFGFIPACAGAASAPFARGPSRTGSSRRAPGQHELKMQRNPGRGFIPACAGAARKVAGAAPAPRVHPGVRRGSRRSDVVKLGRQGSSRRAPGQRTRRRGRRCRRGFIPACAGAALRTETTTGLPWVHPGVRRGSILSRAPRTCARGSSRRAPGQQWHIHGRGLQSGFIPACAGAASAATTCRCATRVHPGVRRGSLQKDVLGGLTKGSSRRAPGQPPRPFARSCN